MIIQAKITAKVLVKVEDTFKDERGNDMPYYQLILNQGNGCENVSCVKDEVFDRVQEGLTCTFFASIDTKRQNRLRLLGVDTGMDLPDTEAPAKAASGEAGKKAGTNPAKTKV